MRPVTPVYATKDLHDRMGHALHVNLVDNLVRTEKTVATSAAQG